MTTLRRSAQNKTHLQSENVTSQDELFSRNRAGFSTIELCHKRRFRNNCNNFYLSMRSMFTAPRWGRLSLIRAAFCFIFLLYFTTFFGWYSDEISATSSDPVEKASTPVHKTPATPAKTKDKTRKGKKKVKNKKIVRVALIGERNSGTNWMVDEVERCFAQTSLKLSKRLTRYKHWFQHENVEERKGNTLVIALFRDPYYWVEAMRGKPHHAPEHFYLNWRQFVTKPWTMKRVGHDLDIKGAGKEDDKKARKIPGLECQENFQYHQVVCCHKYPYKEKKKFHFSEHHPLYELKNDGSGEPYESIVDLRRDKILNFLDIANFEIVKELKVLKYEDLLDRGTEFVIRGIENSTGVKARCKPTPPQQNRVKRTLDEEYTKWITEHVDWKVEALIGYSKRDEI